MIYTASYFQKQNHHGQLISISRSQPKGFNLPTLSIFAPSQSLLIAWKKGMTEQEYVDRFRDEIRGNWPAIVELMRSLEPDVDQTWICWEKSGEFCHRNLVIKIVEKYRPGCYGGMDILKLKEAIA